MDFRGQAAERRRTRVLHRTPFQRRRLRVAAARPISRASDHLSRRRGSGEAIATRIEPKPAPRQPPGITWRQFDSGEETKQACSPQTLSPIERFNVMADTSDPPSFGVADSPHAPFIYYEAAPAIGTDFGVIQITLSAHRLLI